MGLWINNKKLKATALSMHQYCSPVRMMFSQLPEDAVTEAITVYLYTGLAREVFGPRFSDKLRSLLRRLYKFGEPTDIDARVARLSRQSEDYQMAAGADNKSRSPEQIYIDHIQAMIKSFLAEAGQRYEDPLLIKEMFPRLDETIKRIREHLAGIQSQNRFLMRS